MSNQIYFMRDICSEQWFIDAYHNNALVNRAVQFAVHKGMGRDEARLYLIQTLISQNEEIQKVAIERLGDSAPFWDKEVHEHLNRATDEREGRK